MDVVEAINSEVRSALEEHEAEILRGVVAARLSSMTLGELAEFAASPLSQPLREQRLADLVREATAGRGPSTPRSPKRKRNLRGAELEKAILDFLPTRRQGASFSECVARITPASQTSIHRALDRLRARRLIKRVGTKPSRYVLEEGRATRRPSKATRTPTASKRPSKKRNTPEQRAAFEASLLEALGRSATWMSSLELRAAVGGTQGSVHYTLKRLLRAGQIDRQGERSNTKYRLRRVETSTQTPPAPAEVAETKREHEDPEEELG